MNIWKTVSVKVDTKFGRIYGDVPVGSLNEITGAFEPTVNTRGRAYAKRSDLKYRNKRENRSVQDVSLSGD